MYKFIPDTLPDATSPPGLPLREVDEDDPVSYWCVDGRGTFLLTGGAFYLVSYCLPLTSDVELTFE